MSWAWSEEEILNLIDTYREKEVLWNPKSSYHYNRKRRQSAWESIAIAVGLPLDECQRKMTSLLSSLRRERSKVRKGRRAGSIPYESNWFAYKRFNFMMMKNDALDEAAETADNDQLSHQIFIKTYGDSDVDNGRVSPSLVSEAGSDSHTQSINPQTSRKRLKHSQLDPLEETVFKKEHDDECDVFGLLVASKLKKMPELIKINVQQEILNVIFKAEKESLEQKQNSPE